MQCNIIQSKRANVVDHIANYNVMLLSELASCINTNIFIYFWNKCTGSTVIKGFMLNSIDIRTTDTVICLLIFKQQLCALYEKVLQLRGLIQLTMELQLLIKS